MKELCFSFVVREIIDDPYLLHVNNLQLTEIIRKNKNGVELFSVF